MHWRSTKLGGWRRGRYRDGNLFGCAEIILNKVHIVYFNTLHDGDEDGGGDVFSSSPGLHLTWWWWQFNDFNGYDADDDYGDGDYGYQQGCISCGTCSYPQLTEDHVLTSAYVKIFRTVTRNAVHKSVWRKKDCFWLPLNKHAMNIFI